MRFALFAARSASNCNSRAFCSAKNFWYGWSETGGGTFSWAEDTLSFTGTVDFFPAEIKKKINVIQIGKSVYPKEKGFALVRSNETCNLGLKYYNR